jgi:hypothetical protein
MDVKNIVVAPYSVGLLFSTVFSLFPRATSQAGMLACTFGDCREQRGKEAGQRIGIRKKRGRI